MNTPRQNVRGANIDIVADRSAISRGFTSWVYPLCVAIICGCGAPPAVDAPAPTTNVVREAKPLPPEVVSNWPVPRGDALSTGVARGALPADLKLQWKFTVEERAFESTPAIVDGVVYLGDLGSNNGRVYALKLSSGEKLWEFTVDSYFKASPAVQNGRVFVGDINGSVYALEAATGNKLWSFTTDAEINGGANFWNEQVLIGSQDASLYVLDAASGKEVWKFTISDQIRCTPTVVADRCFLAGCDSKFHIVDLAQQKETAAVDIASQTGATPAVIGDRVYFGTQGGTFFCVDWKKAEIAWSDDGRGGHPFEGSPAACDQAVVATQGKKCVAFDPANGHELWTWQSRGKLEASPVIVGERVFVGGHDGRLVALDLASGREVWQQELGGKLIGSPAVASGRLLIANDAGTVFCFGPPKENDE